MDRVAPSGRNYTRSHFKHPARLGAADHLGYEMTPA